MNAKLSSTIVIMVLTGGAATALADTLWYQSHGGAGLWDQDCPDRPASAAYMVDDVHTAAGGWKVDAVTTYFGRNGNYWDSDPPKRARLNVFPKAAGLPQPTEDPRNGQVVDISVTGDEFVWAVRAGNLNLTLGGDSDYWIGLTPIAGASYPGTCAHMRTHEELAWGAPTAWCNPGGALGFGTDWQSLPMPGYIYPDMAVLIEGTVIPEPATAALLALPALVALRRRAARWSGDRANSPGPGGQLVKC